MNLIERLCILFWCATGVAVGIVVPTASPFRVPSPPPAGNFRQCPALVNFPTQCRPMSQCSVWWAELVKSPQSVCTNQADSPFWKACCPAIVGGMSKNEFTFFFLKCFFIYLYTICSLLDCTMSIVRFFLKFQLCLTII